MLFEDNTWNWIILLLCIAVFYTLKALLFDDGSRRFMMVANRNQSEIESALKAYGLTLIEIKDADAWSWIRWPYIETRVRVRKPWDMPELDPPPLPPAHTRLKLVFKNRLGKICEACADVTEDLKTGKTRMDFSPALENFEYADRDMPLRP
jgi:hypothetical protein